MKAKKQTIFAGKIPVKKKIPLRLNNTEWKKLRAGYISDPDGIIKEGMK